MLAHPVSFARSCLRRGEPLPQPDPNAPQKASLVSVPFFHVTGCQAILNVAVANGAKLVLMRRWNAELAMQLIERERCTSAGGVPTIAWQLVEHPALKKYDLSSLESVSYGGAPAAGELVRRLKQVFPVVKAGTGWGMTETSSTFTHVQAEDYEHRPDSCGPPLPVCELKIVAEDGRTLPPGEAGELWAKGPNVVKEYWRKPEATAETFVGDGWLRTGDIARLDDEGFCYIVDRAKDMLIRGGENIYCVEVENVLYQHPAVIDAALVAIPHRTLGEEPGAIVTLAPGAQASGGRNPRLCRRASRGIQSADARRVLAGGLAAQHQRQDFEKRVAQGVHRRRGECRGVVKSLRQLRLPPRLGERVRAR